MKDRVFLDSNIVIYSLGADKFKKEIAVDLLKKSPCISIQVVNEVVNISIKKLKMPNFDAYDIGRMLMNNCKTIPLTENIVLKGFVISQRYGFSFWDSLIVAAAIESECSVLYTEDLQHNQNIENKLIVRNPYLNT
ncbi:MAG: PIN domain-containing protein [Candidatus Omnitrophota bacterium]